MDGRRLCRLFCVARRAFDHQAPALAHKRLIQRRARSSAAPVPDRDRRRVAGLWRAGGNRGLHRRGSGMDVRRALLSTHGGAAVVCAAPNS